MISFGQPPPAPPGATAIPGCPAIAPPEPPSLPTPPARYTRYADPGLQDIYARIVAALQAITVPVYGPVVNDAQADAIARQTVEAMRAAPNSAEMQQRIKCAVMPALNDIARPIIMGAVAVGLLGLLGWTIVRVTR